jgi:4-hydroxy-3-methylbut-2-enyl diphosphate reductase
MGVRRAVDLAYAQAGRAYTLGPLIHNPRVLEELKCRGVETLDGSTLPENLGNVSVIIRAHGVSPQTEADLQKRGAAVVDATCPKVKASQLKASAFARAGYWLFLAGEESHAEITGIRAYAGSAFYAVAGSAAEAEKIAAKLHGENPGAKAALIGQTTISAGEYQAIGEAIAKFFPGLEIAQTICTATRERQDSLKELLNETEAVIIAGGRESANTRRLLATAQASGKSCALVETPADIPPEFFTFQTVGLAAGTSTPDSAIDAIENALGGGAR